MEAVALVCGIPVGKAAEYHSLDLRRLTVSASGAIDRSERRAAAEQTRAFVSYLEEMIERRRAEPRDDLVSYLANAPAKPGEHALTTDEIVSALINVLGAAVGNTVTGIAVMFRNVLLDPRQWQAVLKDSMVIELIVEETLRWHDPAQAVLRITTRPVTIAGKDLPAGARIYAHYGAAQRDPRVFSDPDKFNAARQDLTRHFAMGRGAHICLGAPLARLEMDLSLRCFAERIPGLRLVGDGELAWTPEFVGAQVNKLLLEWDTEQLPPRGE